MDNYVQGFGQSTLQELEELNKALGTGEVGPAYGGTDYADMSALRPQSLEGTLKVVTAGMDQLKLWKTIGKKPAYNTVEEFNVIDSYGGDSSPFFVEGGLPGEEDSNYIRQSQYVKFLGTTRVVTHPATLVRNVVGDMVARESTNGTIWLLKQLEKALYFADSSLDPLAFDGIIPQVTNFMKNKPYESQHVIDLKGNPVDENLLEDLGTIIADNYGGSNMELHMTYQVNKDISKLVMGTTGRQRAQFGSEVTLGAPVRSFESNAGLIKFEPNVFLKPQATVPTKAAKGAPAAPTAPATPVTAGADATSRITAGTYYYFVTAKNSYGESAPFAVGSVAATTGQAVSIIINRVVSDPIAYSYKVYRGTSSDVTKAQFMVEIKDAGTGTTQTIVDRNWDIPGAHSAVLIDNNSEDVLTFKQLAPLMKLPLARISASERFMILMYGMLQIYNPRRIVVLKNIGTLGYNSNRELYAPSFDAKSFGTVRPVQL